MVSFVLTWAHVHDFRGWSLIQSYSLYSVHALLLGVMTVNINLVWLQQNPIISCLFPETSHDVRICYRSKNQILAQSNKGYIRPFYGLYTAITRPPYDIEVNFLKNNSSNFKFNAANIIWLIYGHYTAFIKPIQGHYTAFIRPLHGLNKAIIRPLYGP